MKIILSIVLAAIVSGCEAPDQEARLAALHLPPPGFTGDAAKGRELFLSQCALCHGKEARGTEQGPPLIDNIYRRKHHADFAVHMAVRDGVPQHHWNFGDMPAIPTITPEQAAHVIAYIRQEQSKAGIND